MIIKTRKVFINTTANKGYNAFAFFCLFLFW
jgi:hypothetical protein